MIDMDIAFPIWMEFAVYYALVLATLGIGCCIADTIHNIRRDKRIDSIVLDRFIRDEV